MIVPAKRGFWQLLLTLQGSVLPRVLPQILLVALLSGVAWLMYDYLPNYFTSYSASAFGLLGLLLSLLLGFRNNASYARWWEGRQQLGALIMHARSLGRLAASHLTQAESQATQQQIFLLLRAFNRCLIYGLRDKPIAVELAAILGTEQAQRVAKKSNPADYLLLLLSQQVAYARRKAWLSEIMAAEFEALISELANVQAACERLKTTPIPFAYMLLAHRTAYLFCFLLPFALIATTGLTTPIISCVVAYAFFGLDALSAELEEPFGEQPNQLPLFAIERTLDINLLEAQELPAPPPLTAVKYWLN
ncbi:hypothetical protein AKN87_02950 [Thiopseudomonas alkaliphila]|uniref:bestrophin family protein n=1 Tax=Thiopseudomonas alkaliphila TaxID=1697053 RepID=UPI00069F66F7|nr:bestrophin family ion channel [Thiopseudomonas alkaliphila]AKX44174.1 hypothetical protein AKN87_02950 [Thiopseudomonas alkaliphila]